MIYKGKNKELKILKNPLLAYRKNLDRLSKEGNKF
jgi:hypothetical protein